MLQISDENDDVTTTAAAAAGAAGCTDAVVSGAGVLRLQGL